VRRFPRALGSSARFGVAAAPLLALAAMLLLAAGTAAATPEPVPSLIPPGDPRSEGEGPGVTWAPLAAAVAGVVVLGIVAVGATIIVLRLTRDDR
jgi:hypothetical protein